MLLFLHPVQDRDVQLYTALRNDDSETATHLYDEGVHAIERDGEKITALEAAAKFAPHANTECFEKIFVKAIENERQNGQRVAVKMWDDAVKSLERYPESGRAELLKTVEGMSAVQYVISFQCLLSAPACLSLPHAHVHARYTCHCGSIYLMLMAQFFQIVIMLSQLK